MSASAEPITTALAITTIVSLAGWIVIYRLGLASGRLRAQEDLRDRRSQMATALLTELRVLEQFMRRIRTNVTPLASDWVVPAPYLFANFNRVDLLSAPSVLALMTLHGKISDIAIYRERHAPKDEHTPTQNWYIRLNATYCLLLIGELKPLLLEQGGLPPRPLPSEVTRFPELPPMPPLAFPETSFEYDHTGNLVGPSKSDIGKP